MRVRISPFCFWNFYDLSMKVNVFLHRSPFCISWRLFVQIEILPVPRIAGKISSSVSEKQNRFWFIRNLLMNFFFYKIQLKKYATIKMKKVPKSLMCQQI